MLTAQIIIIMYALIFAAADCRIERPPAFIQRPRCGKVVGRDDDRIFATRFGKKRQVGAPRSEHLRGFPPTSENDAIDALVPPGTLVDEDDRVFIATAEPLDSEAIVELVDRCSRIGLLIGARGDIERLIEHAAHEIGMEPAEIRRRNLIPPNKMPYSTPTLWTYDSGEFVRLMDKCIANSDWKGYAARKKASKDKGKLRGRAVSYYIEFGGIFNDRMEMRFDPSGSLTVYGGTHSHGQGHETSFAMIVSELLGVAMDRMADAARLGTRLPAPGRHRFPRRQVGRGRRIGRARHRHVRTPRRA